MDLEEELQILKKVNNFYYIDHGYFNQSKEFLKITKQKYLILMGILELLTIIIGMMDKEIAPMID